VLGTSYWLLVTGYWLLVIKLKPINKQLATTNEQQVKNKDMAIDNAKHIIGEIDGVRCTMIETGATLERVAFLSDLLSFNNLEVKELKEVSENTGEESKYTIGVTDLIFNPVFAIYERQLKNREGTYVTPGYWKQECIDCDPRYWMRRKSEKKAK
jgi:hypothetical protein